MQAEEKSRFILLKAQEHIPELHEKIVWSAHAVKKLRLENLRKADIEYALKSCEIIEDYPMEGRLLPGCLVLSFVGSAPVHAVIAIDQLSDRLFIITVYKPVGARWRNDWKTRKR